MKRAGFIYDRGRRVWRKMSQEDSRLPHGSADAFLGAGADGGEEYQEDDEEEGGQTSTSSPEQVLPRDAMSNQDF
jgi:hypothetical protein